MRRLLASRVRRLVLVVPMFAGLGSVTTSAELDPKAIAVTIPSDIKWVRGNGSESAVLVGDPAKPGLYVVLQKWLPHHNSHPHFHVNDRYIMVLSGTWWVNTGAKYDPEGMKPVPAGSFVTHFAKEIHYDGARDAECILEIVGMGPATTTQAEAK
ncbi:MAG: cupin domain-containing protein [Acidobacteriota bacterium]